MIKHLKHLVLLAFMAVASTAFAQYEWHKTTAPDFRGKQDDIYFVDEDKGWYVNGTGKIYKTVNGGQDWQLIFEKPGTFFRCIGFIDSLRGFVGNIGTDYFPNVADTVPLYKTTDGGKTWEAVQYKGPVVKGLCAIDILKVPFVNHGVLDYKYYINAGGRVGSPAYLMRSYDNGKTFTSEDVNAHCAFILDIKFLNEQEGFIMAGSDNVLTKSNALILRTADGGKSWKKVYQSNRPYEITWKASFPTAKVGYVTIQSYNPDTTVTTRYLVKSINGGKSWEEIPVADDFSLREFGIGFLNEKVGWIGTNKSGLETTDGGKTWTKKNMGNAINKIRIVQKAGGGSTGYAIGSNVYKLDVKKG